MKLTPTKEGHWITCIEPLTLNQILSELEGETLIEAGLLLENQKVREAIKGLMSGKLTSKQVVAVINNQH